MDIVYTQDDLQKNVAAALADGNAEALSSFFNTSVDVSIYNQDEVYSKAHAKQILTDFFSLYKVESFQIEFHNNEKYESTTFGTLVTSKGSFRVSYITRLMYKKNLVYSLKLETLN